ALDRAHALDHALAVPVRGVDDDHVDTGPREQFGALLGVATDADCRAHPQFALFVLAGVRVLGGLQDVLDGDQPAQLERVVDDQHALEPVTVHQRLRFFERGPFPDRDQPLARRHDPAGGLVEPGLETKVAVGDDADHLAVVDDRQPGDPVLLGQVDHVEHLHLRRDRDRVGDDTGFVTLDARDLGGLLRGSEVLVDDSDAAFLGDGDRQAGFGDRVHRRGHQRDVQADPPREAGLQGGVAGKDFGEGWNQQDVVERQRLFRQSHGTLGHKSRLYRCVRPAARARLPSAGAGGAWARRGKSPNPQVRGHHAMPAPRPLSRALAVAGLLIALPALAGTWQWRDASGRMVYSDMPPPPDVRASQILRAPTPASQPASATAAPDATPASQPRAGASAPGAAPRT